MARIALALGLWLALAGAAPIRLITQLSQARIEINTTFRGSEMLVFGAIQYPQGSVPDAPPDIERAHVLATERHRPRDLHRIARQRPHH